MKKIYKYLYFWVILAIVIGGTIGSFFPNIGIKLKIFSDVFITLIQLIVGPLIFSTITLGFAKMGNIKNIGRVGLKTIIYFEIISSMALIIGLLIANIWQPGSSMHVDINKMHVSHHVTDMIEKYSSDNNALSFENFLKHLIPTRMVGAFTDHGNLLQILFLAILFGVAITSYKGKKATIIEFIDELSNILFKIMDFIMLLSPIAAGSAIAYTVGYFGFHSLKILLGFVAVFYFTCFLFIILVLGSIAKVVGFNIFKFLNYIKSELMIILGTSSSESALAVMMQKLEKLGCKKSMVSLVMPTGYSFNLDGTNIYITLATLFIAQAVDVHLSFLQQLAIIGVAMLTSKGAAGVSGAGFITLIVTFNSIPYLPVEALTLVFGVDKFMSEARAMTNFIGNGIATIFLSKTEKALDIKQLHHELK